MIAENKTEGRVIFVFENSENNFDFIYNHREEDENW